MSAQSNNQLAIERGEIMENAGSKQQSISKRAPRKNEVSQIKCPKQKLSKSKLEINPGSKLRVLAVTISIQYNNKCGLMI